MKYIFLLFTLLITIFTASSNTNPHQINKNVPISATNSSLRVQQYFSLTDIPEVLSNKQWYAFLTIHGAEEHFWMKFYVQLSTVPKNGQQGKNSDVKVMCHGNHNDLHTCFISNRQIKPKQENLKVVFQFQDQAQIEIKIQINSVYNLKIGEQVTLQKSKSNFTRILRIDLRQFDDQYQFFMVQLMQSFIVDEYNNAMSFFVALQQIPPDQNRYSAASFPFWDNREMIVYLFEELTEVEYITIVVGITDLNTYRLWNRVIKHTQQVQLIEPYRYYNQISAKSKNYRLELPQRTTNSYYLLQLQIQSMFQFTLENPRINGKDISRQELSRLLMQNGSIKTNNQIDLWLDSTIKTFEFTLKFLFGCIFSIYLSQFDLEYLSIPQKVIWNDFINPNSSQYLYLVIDTKTPDTNFNLQIQAFFMTQLSVIDFRNCVQKSVELCKEIVMSNNFTKKSIGIPKIQPNSDRRNGINYYRFSQSSITKHQLQPYLYRSILVVNITAIRELIYSIKWSIINPIQVITENQLIKSSIQKDEVKIYCFTVLNASSLAFARVHFIHGTMASYITGTTQYIDPSQLHNNKDKIVSAFDGSVTFTSLSNKKTYYIYVWSSAKDIFQITLTYGYSQDDNLLHPISYLTLGEHSSNHLVMQPLQILFIQIRVNSQHSYALLTVENTVPLKICYLLQTEKPTSHEDMKKSTTCETYSTVNHFPAFNFNHTRRAYFGIQNQRNQSSSIILTTEHDMIKCSLAQMGRTRYILVDRRDSNGTQFVCLLYTISRSQDIEILVDLNNPKLQGVAHPQIKIGDNWKTPMTTNLMMVTAEDVDSYCDKGFQHCYLSVQIKITKDHRIFQEYIPVTVSYTSQPTTLKDGLAHHSAATKNEKKHFKYPIYTNDTIEVVAKTIKYSNIEFFAKIILSTQKFSYPEREDYNENISDIYKSQSNGYFYPSILQIKSNDINKKCNKIGIFCYALITLYTDDSVPQEDKLIIEVTQTITTLTTGNSIDKYLQKDSKAYFNYKNSQGKSILFFTTSNIKNGLKIDVYEGNDGPHSMYALVSNTGQALIDDAKTGWYTISVLATQSCYFTIQATSSQKMLRQFSKGYANQFKLQTGEKSYYFLHNQDDSFKLISSMAQGSSGQLILKAMTITDNQMPDFVKFINNQLQINKKTNLEFTWSGINHLSLSSKDPKFCINCYICIELEASKAAKGYLSIPSDNQFSLFLTEYISYDTLMKEETFTWIAGYSQKTQDIYISLQAGQAQIIIVEAYSKQKLGEFKIKYNKIDSTLNRIKISNNVSNQYQNIKIKITAKQYTDYSIYSELKNQNESSLTFIEVGRPNILYLSSQQKSCFYGKLFSDQNQFLINSYSQKDLTRFGKTIEITGKIDGNQTILNKQLTPTVLIISYAQFLGDNKNFVLCFENKDNTSFSANVMYIGNLNFIMENSVVHFKKSVNLTFISEGKGVIEVDQCANRSTISLNSDYKDIKSISSKINSRRISNNLITFNHYGEVYLHADTSNYVGLRWKNLHQSTSNGYGYEIYSPSTFLINYDKTTQDLSLKIKPLEKDLQATKLPELVSLDYKVFISGGELELYNAMNCERGTYMQWIKHIQDPSQMSKQVIFKLNNIEDLKLRFKTKDYVLIIVKAEVKMKWANNFSEQYRFYYPYQELMLSQFYNQLSKDDNKQNSESNYDMTFFGIFLVVAVIIVGVLVIIAIRLIKRRMWRYGFFTDEDEDNKGTELENKVASGSINSGIK